MTIITHLTTERPSDPALAAFEATFEGTFPDDYRLFLQRDNGGRPRERLFQLATRNGGTEAGVIDYFFALHTGNVGSLKRTLVSHQNKLPAEHLPIATDSFGNLILLKLDGPNPGQVFFWDHEEEESTPTTANLSRIANSFTEFVESLALETR